MLRREGSISDISPVVEVWLLRVLEKEEGWISAISPVVEDCLLRVLEAEER